MSVIFRTVERPSDPRVENSPKKYFPQLVTLGQSVNLAFIAQKMQDRSSLSIGDIRSVVQNFVEKLKEQLLEGKTVNIAGLGVFMLAAKSKGSDKAEDITTRGRKHPLRIPFTFKLTHPSLLIPSHKRSAVLYPHKLPVIIMKRCLLIGFRKRQCICQRLFPCFHTLLLTVFPSYIIYFLYICMSEIPYIPKTLRTFRSFFSVAAHTPDNFLFQYSAR